MQIIPPQKNEALEQLLRHCHRRRYASKTAIIKPGDAGEILYFIAEGSVAVRVFNEEAGHEIVLAYLNKGDFIGEVGVFLGNMVRDVTVVTKEPTQLAEIGYVRLQQLLRNELREYAVDLLTLFGKQLSHRLLTTSRKVSNMAFLDATGRIEQTLKDLCKQPDAMTHPEGHQIRVTRQEIGRIVGCSREMAGKILKTLEEQGQISVSGKTIVVFGTR